MLPVLSLCENRLRLVPDHLIDDRIAVIIDDQVTKFQGAFVKGIGEEGREAVHAPIQPGCALDFFQRAAGQQHLVCLLDHWDKLRIRSPTMHNSWAPITPGGDLDRVTQESARRGSGHSAIALDQLTQAGFDICAEVQQELFILPVQGSFEKPAHGTFRDFVIQAVDNVAAPAQISAEELGVIDISGEALVIPDDQASFLSLTGAKVAHHRLEAAPADDR